MTPKKHIGKRTTIKYIGGNYHGKRKVLRAPLRDVIQVANPPRYLGNNQYDSNIIGYETYYLRLDSAGESVYVWEDWLEDWNRDQAEVINREFESSNARAIRIENEENERKRKQAEADFKTLGVAVFVDDERVHPSRVKVYVNTKHPHYEQMFIKREKLYNDEHS